jgi:hypothetical protein
MNEEELTRLESKIYIFSVNVFSFIKTLMEHNIANKDTQGLFDASSKLYTEFLNLFDNHGVKNKLSVFSKCRELANSSAVHLTNIEVKGSLLNERVDLLIEAKEILRFLEKLKEE